jgi:amino-acid N-acetyltransferase
MKEKITIGAARGDEIVAISSLLAANRDDPGLFQESPAAIAEALEDFLVARTEQGETVGCAGLHRETPELGEIYAVAVDPKRQGQGIGRQLMRACQREASAKGILRLWLATIKPVYFERYGFQTISRWQLPASVLLRKLRMVFQQPAGRRLPALVGRHTFMCCDVSPEEGGHGFRPAAPDQLGLSVPCKFECIGQGRSAWCTKAELSDQLIQRHQGGSSCDLCITSAWMYTSRRSAFA